MYRAGRGGRVTSVSSQARLLPFEREREPGRRALAGGDQQERPAAVAAAAALYVEPDGAAKEPAALG